MLIKIKIAIILTFTALLLFPLSQTQAGEIGITPAIRNIVQNHFNSWITGKKLLSDKMDNTIYRNLFMDLQYEKFFSKNTEYSDELFFAALSFYRKPVMIIRNMNTEYKFIFTLFPDNPKKARIEKILASAYVSTSKFTPEFVSMIEKHVNRWQELDIIPNPELNNLPFKKLFRDLKKMGVFPVKESYRQNMFKSSLYFEEKPFLFISLSPSCCNFKFSSDSPGSRLYLEDIEFIQNNISQYREIYRVKKN